MTWAQFLSDFWAMFQDPKTWMMAGWIFATAVGAMPAPIQSDSRRYVWFYNFLQRVAANHSLVK